MGKFFNISNSYSPSISLTTTMNLCHKERGVYKASTGNTRCEGRWGEEDTAAWVNLVGIGCYSCALLAAEMICSTRGSTPGGWNETLGPCRSTGCITILPSFQPNSKAGKKKEKKKFNFKKIFPIPSRKNISWRFGPEACVSAVL